MKKLTVLLICIFVTCMNSYSEEDKIIQNVEVKDIPKVVMDIVKESKDTDAIAAKLIVENGIRKYGVKTNGVDYENFTLVQVDKEGKVLSRSGSGNSRDPKFEKNAKTKIKIDLKDIPKIVMEFPNKNYKDFIVKKSFVFTTDGIKNYIVKGITKEIISNLEPKIDDFQDLLKGSVEGGVSVSVGEDILSNEEKEKREYGVIVKVSVDKKGKIVSYIASHSDSALFIEFDN